MTSLRKLSAQVTLRLGAAKPDSRYHPLEIIEALRQTRDTFLRVDYFQSMDAAEREISPDLLSVSDPLPVLKDDTSEYAELPWPVLRLPRNAGLQHVGPVKDRFMAFIPTRPGDQSLLRNHHSFHTEGMPSYWQEGTKVRMVKPVKFRYPDLVAIGIRASASFEEDEELTLPADAESVLVQKAFEQLLQRPPEDNVIDNTDKL
jgi:hypothetical protein